MPVRISPRLDVGILEAVYSGDVSASELVDSIRMTESIATRLGLRLWLADCSALTGGHSIFDLYGAVEEVATYERDHSIKEAVITRARDVDPDRVHFWEVVCRNRGLQVRSFVDRQAAVAWLLA